MNRGARRLTLFDGPDDYRVFVEVLEQATRRLSMRLLCWVAMPNHWHLVLWPEDDEDLSMFMAWMTSTHSRRWHLAHKTVGTGTIYQGRFKAIPVRDDRHFLIVCRYVERNPVRAQLVEKAEEWDWGSASKRSAATGPRTHEWPVPRPESWGDESAAEATAELGPLRKAIRRGIPFGPDSWRDQTATQLGWQMGVRSRGRPRGTGGVGKK